MNKEREIFQFLDHLERNQVSLNGYFNLFESPYNNLTDYKELPHISKNHSREYENIKLREALNFLNRYPELKEPVYNNILGLQEKGFLPPGAPPSDEILYFIDRIPKYSREIVNVIRNADKEFLLNHYYDIFVFLKTVPLQFFQ